MSYSGKMIVFGALAASLTLGAVQLASGHDLTRGLLTTSSNVNRATKGDRAAALMVAPTKTVALHLSQFADTTFLLRLPSAAAQSSMTRQDAGNTGASPSLPQQLITTENDKRSVMRQPIACEPSVSVLTEIAKRLQPGRCIT